MKRTFWIVYAIVLLIVIVGGYLLLNGVKKDNLTLAEELARKENEIEKIEMRINKQELPNRIWPEIYQQRLERYNAIEGGLQQRLEAYNLILTKKIPGTGRLELFDGEFKAAWMQLLGQLVAARFEVGNPQITAMNVQEQFESGVLANALGVRMDWVSGGGVQTPTPGQRLIAEEQYWIQKKLIEHFIAAETANNWAEYIFKTPEIKKEEETVMDGGFGGYGGMQRPRYDTGNQTTDPTPGIQRIAFAAPTAVRGRGPMGYQHQEQMGSPYGNDNNEVTRDYITEGTFTNEYNFTAELRIRMSSIPAFLNNLVTDNELFFVVDTLNVKAISAGTEDEKIGRDPKAALTSVSEPPVDVELTGRILFFDFERMTSVPKKTGPAKSKNSKTPPGPRR